MFKKFKPFEAPSSIEFKDPDTGHIYKSKTYAGLYKDIIQYRAQNNLEQIENLKETVENYICTLPENCNKCTGVELHRSFYQYIKGGVALVKNIAFRQFASLEVAEKRALQCVSCENNVFPDKDNFLAWSDNIAIMQVGERRSSLHDKLGNCAVCSCPLKSKVFVDGVLPAPTKEEEEGFKKVNCWQLGIERSK